MIGVPKEVLEVIGEVAVNAAILETVMVRVAIVIDHTLDHDHLLKSTTRLRDALAKTTEALDAANPQLGGRATQWRSKAERKLEDRNAVVHAVIVHDDTTSPSTLSSWHPRNDVFQPFDLLDARALAKDIGTCAAAGIHLSNLIFEKFPSGVVHQF